MFIATFRLSVPLAGWLPVCPPVCPSAHSAACCVSLGDPDDPHIFLRSRIVPRFCPSRYKYVELYCSKKYKYVFQARGWFGLLQNRFAGLRTVSLTHCHSATVIVLCECSVQVCIRSCYRSSRVWRHRTDPGGNPPETLHFRRLFFSRCLRFLPAVAISSLREAPLEAFDSDSA